MMQPPHTQKAQPLLAQWQDRFYLSLFDQLTPELKNSFLTHSDVAATQRFAIYQNNVFYSLTTALGDLYPVIKQLVGDDFFTGTAGIYFRRHPPQQAAMVFLGENFAEFLRTFEHTAKMTYLADMAELELARHRAYHATDKTPLEADTVASIAPEVLATSSVELHPSLYCVSSADPIFTIWQNNQEPDNNKQQNTPQETIQLGEPQHILVVRPTYTVCMYHIDKSLFQFIQRLQYGDTLETAIDSMLNDHPTFDVGRGIQFILQTQLITQIHHTNNHSPQVL